MDKTFDKSDFLKLFTLILFLFSFTKSDDFLFWTKLKRLNFTDFQGTVIKQDSTNGETYRLGTISTSIDVRIRKEVTSTIFSINAGMEKKQSWIRNSGDSVTLRHLQGSFDICEIYARKFRKQIKSVKSLEEANGLYGFLSSQKEKEQVEYENANAHDKNGISKLWQDSINNRLKSLDSFQFSKIILKLTK